MTTARTAGALEIAPYAPVIASRRRAENNAPDQVRVRRYTPKPVPTLWQVNLGASVTNGPMTYELDGTHPTLNWTLYVRVALKPAPVSE